MVSLLGLVTHITGDTQHEPAALRLQAQAATVTTKPVVAFVEYSDYDYDFEISFAPYKVDFIQVRGWTCTQLLM